MDYISQTEKIIKYLELKLGIGDTCFIFNLKKRFCSDLNLLGCFIKDFLTVELNRVPLDDEIYDDFVICFENADDDILNRLDDFSKYYLTLVFEDTTDRILLNAICTVNSCFAIDCYPILMKVMDKYLNHTIDVKRYALMLKSIVDIVINRYENPQNYDVDFASVDVDELINLERLAI